MAGKVVLITGATDGIGKQAAIALLRLGATVYAVGRNPQKSAAALDEMRSAGGGQADMLLADLSSMAEVRRLAAEVRERTPRLDVLVNNAGAIFYEYGETVDGFERTFALNHLAYFVLTTELLDLLKTSAPSRIISVSSDAHQGGTMDWTNLQRKGYGSTGAFNVYAQSKLANILFSSELARRLEGTGVTSNALHPGFVRTSFGRTGPGYITGFMGVIQNMLAITPEKGAETIVYLASSPEVEGVTGKYFAKSAVAVPQKRAQDAEAARRLWQVSEQLVAPVAV